MATATVAGSETIQSKKKALVTLEEALKKRVLELRELCLKEGEIIGHLPADYPLQPREPIPQIRRRQHQNNFAANDSEMIHYLYRQHDTSRQQPNHVLQQNVPQTIISNKYLSSSSSSSTTSSISRNQQQLQHQQKKYTSPNFYLPLASNSSQSLQYSTRPSQKLQEAALQIPACKSSHHSSIASSYSASDNCIAVADSHFKKPLDQFQNGDFLAYQHPRAGSTASSTSSSTTGGSSSISVATIPEVKANNYNNTAFRNIHTRSASETCTNKNMHQILPSQKSAPKSILRVQRQPNPSQQPPLPPRMSRVVPSSSTDENTSPATVDCVDGKVVMREPSEKLHQQTIDEPKTGSGDGRCTHYYEETKPYQISDFYKYSNKHRQQTTAQLANSVKTIKSLDESYSCDQAEDTLREGGKRLVEATAKAIAANPALASQISEKLGLLYPRNSKIVHQIEKPDQKLDHMLHNSYKPRVVRESRNSNATTSRPYLISRVQSVDRASVLHP